MVQIIIYMFAVLMFGTFLQYLLDKKLNSFNGLCIITSRIEI